MAKHAPEGTGSHGLHKTITLCNTQVTNKPIRTTRGSIGLRGLYTIEKNRMESKEIVPIEQSRIKRGGERWCYCPCALRGAAGSAPHPESALLITQPIQSVSSSPCRLSRSCLSRQIEFDVPTHTKPAPRRRPSEADASLLAGERRGGGRQV
jgi:hypothetical protein